MTILILLYNNYVYVSHPLLFFSYNNIWYIFRLIKQNTIITIYLTGCTPLEIFFLKNCLIKFTSVTHKFTPLGYNCFWHSILFLKPLCSQLKKYMWIYHFCCVLISKKFLYTEYVIGLLVLVIFAVKYFQLYTIRWWDGEDS